MRTSDRTVHRGFLPLVACLLGGPACPVLAAPPLAPDHAARMARGLALFKSDVRGILVETCLKCHGGEKVKSKFDLGSREALLRGGHTGIAVVPGKPGQGLLMPLLRHEEDPPMPHKADKLPADQIARIGKWIELGAPYDRPLVEARLVAPGGPARITEEDRRFWSFLPLQAAAPPAVRDRAWVRTPIDRFILARLEGNGLVPNAPANKRKLIRRAHLDLLGLPPDPSAVEAFVSDQSPDAYPRLIDQLLESPHYGERWARHWMDVARFAESHGYEQDYDRKHAYHYRDFLIRAFNADMPYDQFVRWQIAGDELAPDNPLALMATGFLGAGAFPTQLTEMEFESARYDELDDMTATTGSAFLGLSIGCARCHDHKYDPIPAADYYRLAASFTTTIRSEIDLDLSPVTSKQVDQRHRQKLAALEADLKRFEREKLPGMFEAYVLSLKQGKAGAVWQVLQFREARSQHGTQLKTQDDWSILASGPRPNQEVYTLVADADLAGITAIRIEALTHPSLPRRGPGRAGNGNFVLGEFRVTAAPRRGGRTQAVKLVGAEATHQQDTGGLSIAASISDTNPTTGWAVDRGGIGRDQAAVFQVEQPVGGEGGSTLTFTLRFGHPNPHHSLGRFRLSVTSAPQPVRLKPAMTRPTGDTWRLGVEPILRGDKPDPKHHQAALAWYAGTVPQWQVMKKKLDDEKKSGSGRKLVKVQVTSEGFKPTKHHADGRGFPHFYKQTHILSRGDVNQKGEVAAPSFLRVLMRNDKAESHWRVQAPADWKRTSFRRTALAGWLTDENDGAGHLVARVIVNRLWHHHFGDGIVASPNDFGSQGARPSHPDLLEWLARDLVENGWKLKRLHKLIMTSSVYMQSSAFDSARAEVDRENRYRWRWTPRRLEAEAIRDSLLAVSGLLDPRMYGPGTLDQNMRRRSVYFFIKRSKLIPVMMLFDWPEHLVSIGRRNSTTIAPQALAFMNSPQVRQYAQGVARRVGGAASPVPQRVQAAYRLLLARDPDPRELALATDFLSRQAHSRGGSPDKALADLCQVLLSLNEFLFLD